MQPTEECIQCSGWGDSCSVDSYPDDCEPNAGFGCAGFEMKANYQIRYITYNNPEMHNIKFCNSLEEAELIKTGLSKLKHVSDIRIIKGLI